MKSIILVGEQVAHGADPNKPLWPLPRTGSGGRLMAILGLTYDEYMVNHDRVNLCRHEWDTMEAINRARRILRYRPPNSGIVVLGRRGERAFGWVYRRYEVRYVLPGLYMLALPHPSGLCREWNDDRNIQLARDAYAELRCKVANGSGVCGV